MFNTGANLFTAGDFISHAGLPLKWKIECDAIRPEEWDCLAQMIMDYQHIPFKWVDRVYLEAECHLQVLYENMLILMQMM